MHTWMGDEEMFKQFIKYSVEPQLTTLAASKSIISNNKTVSLKTMASFSPMVQL